MTDQTPATRNKVLLTGATGYVGGRLLPLLESCCQLRCLTRNANRLSELVSPTTEIFEGDIFDRQAVENALEGVHTAYYLIHSMGSGKDFEAEDRTAAEIFADACTKQGVRRIIYLGGLGNPDHRLSKHLRSRQEIGNILRTASSSVIEFRASIIIGSGSLSFEMIRALVERLPVMICPKWVQVLAQPISIEDVLFYMLEALNFDDDESFIFEIGGPDRLSYGQLMQEYARQRGLKRWMIPVPFLTPYLSSLWLGLVTPLYARVGRKLVESLRNPTLVSNNLAERMFPIRPRSTAEAITRALINEDQDFAATRWSDALSSGGKTKHWGGVGVQALACAAGELSSGGNTKHWGGTRFGSRLVDSRVHEVDLPPADAFAPIRRIGGKTGWYYGNWLWKIRGFLDLLVGGVGVRRGRRDDDRVFVGDTIDFWRVEAIEPNRRLRLRAEMKVPGRAWLEFEVEPIETGSRVRQTAIFDPVGLFGLVYWYSLYPLHQFVFAGMLRNICKAMKRT